MKCLLTDKVMKKVLDIRLKIPSDCLMAEQLDRYIILFRDRKLTRESYNLLERFTERGMLEYVFKKETTYQINNFEYENIDESLN
ncbi:hypothetical protein J4481_02310 [Candidatus Pacearchaeota archaeon]|nr:hypothetical protein [Candidatus Pacearchaeota archaeon]